MGGWRYSSIHSYSQHWIEISDQTQQTHASTASRGGHWYLQGFRLSVPHPCPVCLGRSALSVGTGPPVTVGLRIECALLWSGRCVEANKCCPLSEVEPRFPAC
jgi:hypothetical protein